MLCEGWEKGWWATHLLGRKKDHHVAPGHPPAGTALRVPVRQVRSTHSTGTVHGVVHDTDMYLSVCTHLVLLTKVHLLMCTVSRALVAWDTHTKKMKTPGPYNLQRFCNLRGWICVCTRESTVHTYTPDQERGCESSSILQPGDRKESIC